MRNFADLPEQVRFAALMELDKLKAENAGYTSNGICVALPRNYNLIDFRLWADKYGLHYDGMHYFSLGSDTPRQELRHNGPYQSKYDRPGYWLYAHFAMKTGAA